MNKKRLVVAFSGPSNSGKTTAIVKVASILQDSDFKVCIVKHDPKDKAMFDREGKDSFKFSQTGADVAVVSPNKTTIFKKDSSTIDELISIFDDFDYFDKYEFIYEYNSNNQPLTCTSKIYSSGVLLRTTLTTFYYYQGDVIPN